MLRNFSENSFSDRASNSEIRCPNGNERARETVAESQMLMERKMSSSRLAQTCDRSSARSVYNFGRVAWGAGHKSVPRNRQR